MPTRSTRNRMEDQRKDHIDPEGSLQRNHPKQLQTHNMTTDEVENVNSTNKGWDLQLVNKSRIVQRGTERMPQRSRGTRELLYIDQHILNENKTRRKNLPMAWIDNKKAYDMVPQSWIINCLKMYKICHKLYQENHENLDSETDSMREKLSWSEDQKRYISRRFTLTVTIHNCDDATKQHTQKINRKDQSPNVHGRHQTEAKNEKEL